MPHVIVKLYSGRSHRDKSRLSAAITEAVTSTLGYPEASVSVAMEDVNPRDWLQQVYQPDIAEKQDQLFKKPGYGPGDL
ncbi:MAG: tautomerase family protein [Proteobacteria bacterium]|nr:tautomerase family protein [Pseudomonadota bacterium]